MRPSSNVALAAMLLAALPAWAQPAPVAAQPAPVAAPAPAPAPPAALAPLPRTLQFLTTADAQPQLLLPPPPPRGSPAEMFELGVVKRIVETASPERLAQARADGLRENPTIFNNVVGIDLTTLPVTWALLRTVQAEANTTTNIAKRYFARTRPWGVDPTLPNCNEEPNKPPLLSYPSGHATLGYSAGLMLAQLLPSRAPAILARAHDYALSRLVCGQHFASDVEAGHVIGTYVVTRLLLAPALQDRIAAARAELVAAHMTGQ